MLNPRMVGLLLLLDWLYLQLLRLHCIFHHPMHLKMGICLFHGTEKKAFFSSPAGTSVGPQPQLPRPVRRVRHVRAEAGGVQQAGQDPGGAVPSARIGHRTAGVSIYLRCCEGRTTARAVMHHASCNNASFQCIYQYRVSRVDDAVHMHAQNHPSLGWFGGKCMITARADG